MSWLFGYKTQPTSPDLPKPAENSQQTDGKTKEEKLGSQTAYSFDSTALERAASAAKVLEGSSNARQAFEITRMQETTRQQEIDLQRKVFALKLMGTSNFKEHDKFYKIFDFFNQCFLKFSKWNSKWPHCKRKMLV
jgi:hypothetical protein